MNLQHPSFQDISLIHAAVQANEEEERAHSQPAKPLPSQESHSIPQFGIRNTKTA